MRKDEFWERGRPAVGGRRLDMVWCEMTTYGGGQRQQQRLAVGSVIL